MLHSWQYTNKEDAPKTEESYSFISSADCWNDYSNSLSTVTGYNKVQAHSTFNNKSRRAWGSFG